MKDSIRFVEILITEETKIESNKIYQRFKYNPKDKNKKFLLDPCYILYNKFEQKIRQKAFYDEEVVFTQRINDDGEILLIYDILDKEALTRINKNSSVFKLVDYVPPNKGCAYCIHKKNIDENFFTCCYKDKVMTKEYKTCKFFKQKKLFKS